MAVERTLSIIKPDCCGQESSIGQIYTRFENAGLKIIAARMVQLSRADAEGFYAVTIAPVRSLSIWLIYDFWSSNDSGAGR